MNTNIANSNKKYRHGLNKTEQRIGSLEKNYQLLISIIINN